MFGHVPGKVSVLSVLNAPYPAEGDDVETAVEGGDEYAPACVFADVIDIVAADGILVVFVTNEMGKFSVRPSELETVTFCAYPKPVFAVTIQRIDAFSCTKLEAGAIEITVDSACNHSPILVLKDSARLTIVAAATETDICCHKTYQRKVMRTQRPEISLLLIVI